MLFQPTNMMPSSFAGAGGDVIDANVINEFSLQLNGNSPVLAYNIKIMENTIDSIIKYTTNKVTLGVPINPTNYDGEKQSLKVNIPASGTSTLANGNEYKWTVQLWWGGTDDDSIISGEMFFKAAAAPSLVISNVASVVTSRIIELTATYSQAQNSGIQWFKWVLAKKDGSDRTEIVGATEEIYSPDIRYVYNALEHGHTYSARVTVLDNDGITTESNWYDFDVEYAQISVTGFLNAEQNKYNGISLEWAALEFIQGELEGPAISYLENEPAQRHKSVLLASGNKVVFGGGEPPLEIPDSNVYVWQGKLPQSTEGTFLSVDDDSSVLEIKYLDSVKRYVLYYGGVMMAFVNMPVVANRWFNIRATKNTIEADMIKAENPEGMIAFQMSHAGSVALQVVCDNVSFFQFGTNQKIARKEQGASTQTVSAAISAGISVVNVINNFIKTLKILIQSGQGKVINADLSGLTALESFDGGGNLVGTLNISGLTALKTLIISKSPDGSIGGVSSLVLGSSYPALETIDISENNLPALDYSKFPNLKSLKMANVGCAELLLGSNTKLQELILADGESKDIDPILTDQAKMVALANSLPNRSGQSKGIIESYPSNRDWIKAICEGKNWETYRMAVIGVHVDTRNSNWEELRLPVQTNGDVIIDWGDGVVDKVSQPSALLEIKHRYPVTGGYDNYTIRLYFNNLLKLGSGGNGPHFFRSSIDAGLYAPPSRITSIDIKELSNLQHIAFRSVTFFVGSLDITGMTNLTSIGLDNGPGTNARVTSLITGGTIYPKVTWLDLDGNPLGNFDLSIFPGITSSILIANTGRSVLDVSPCPNVTYIRIDDSYTDPYSVNQILFNQTNMINFANTLPNRVGKSSGKIDVGYLGWARGNTAWAWIESICASKNWVRGW